MFEELSPDKERAIKAYAAMSVLFFVITVSIGFIMAADRGYGTGPWDTDTTWSCNSGNGAHYLPDKPRSEQPCPQPRGAGLIARAKKGD